MILLITKKSDSLNIKIQILNYLQTGKSAMVVGKHFGVHESTISSIMKIKMTTITAICSDTKLSMKFLSYTRNVPEKLSDTV